MNKQAIALAMAALSTPLSCYNGTTKYKGPSGSPKRNQERSIKRMAQRSRVINRMRNK